MASGKTIRSASPLVKLVGFPATLLHGDTLVLDRWLWISSRVEGNRKNGVRVSQPRNGGLPAYGEAGLGKAVDIGCGAGAFTIGLARGGYSVLGLTWSPIDCETAESRATICRTPSARFEVQDVRQLDQRKDLIGGFDLAVCTEVVEHILNDKKLLIDVGRLLRPGGRLLLTTPFYGFRAITSEDYGPYSTVEDGGHVRRGYTVEQLEVLCRDAGLTLKSYTYCSGILSQKITTLMRWISRASPLLAWAVTLPLRPFPLVFDRWLTPLLNWPCFSICIEAEKP